MKCQVLIDWLTFSVKETDPSKVIQTYLGMDPVLFQDTGYSLMGYNKVMRFSDILVCSEGREDDYFKDMGVCVSIHPTLGTLLFLLPQNSGKDPNCLYGCWKSELGSLFSLSLSLSLSHLLLTEASP